MSENDNKGGSGLFWAILLFLGGGVAFAINKLMGKPKDTTTDSSTIDGTTTGTTGGNPKNITPKPTVDKYSYGSQIMDGAGTAKNSNSDIEVSVSDIMNKVIVSQYKFKYNQYVFNLSITNKLNINITVERILLELDYNGKTPGISDYEGVRNGISNPFLIIKPKGKITKVMVIKQRSDANQYTNDGTFLEESWNKNYTLTVKGIIDYKKYENDVMDSGQIGYLDLISNHAIEATQPFNSEEVPRLTVAEGGGSVPTCKSKYGIGSYMPKKNELNSFYKNK